MWMHPHTKDNNMPEYTLHDYDDNEAKQPASAGCHPTTCSPSSDTPKSDKLAAMLIHPDSILSVRKYVKKSLKLSRKLERKLAESIASEASETRWAAQYKAERDEARQTAEIFRACAERKFGPMPFPRKFLWENSEL